MTIDRILIITLLAAFLALPGCRKDADVSRDGDTQLSVSLSVEGDAPATRSVLPENDLFESTIRGVSVFAYNSATGELVAAKYFTTSRFALTLTRTVPHTIYVLANMGDLTATAPKSELDLVNYSYDLVSYASIQSKGMPMVGTKSVAAGATSAPISLRRLLAKLVMTVDHTELCSGGAESPFTGGTFRLRQASRILYPFAPGGSAARSAADLFSGNSDYASADSELSFVDPDEPVTGEITPGHGVWEDVVPEDGISDEVFPGDAVFEESAIGEIVLFIPENRQGVLLPGNDNQMDKSLSNGLLSGSVQAERCTYIEFDGRKSGSVDGVQGQFLYRFYPGADSTQSFDLEGGKRYDITLILTWEGLFVEGNWMVEKSGWSDSRDIHISVGGEETFERDIYVELPPGVSDFYYDIYYSPHGLPYSPTPENGSYRHREYGWNYDLDDMTADAFNCTLSANDDVCVTAVSQGGAVTTYRLSIPWDDMLVGESHVITQYTMDRRHESTLYLDIVEPEINPSPMEIVMAWDEYGASNPFTFRVIGGSVPLRYISADCTNANVSLGAFNAENGTVTGYWKTANTGSTRREANIVFSGLDGIAVCKAYQGGQSSFWIGVDDDGGEGDNNYD